MSFKLALFWSKDSIFVISCLLFLSILGTTLSVLVLFITSVILSIFSISVSVVLDFIVGTRNKAHTLTRIKRIKKSLYCKQEVM
jgi:5-bromo-4-chloroindolyl phosphate hydrolysis protein